VTICEKGVSSFDKGAASSQKEVTTCEKCVICINAGDRVPISDVDTSLSPRNYLCRVEQYQIVSWPGALGVRMVEMFFIKIYLLESLLDCLQSQYNFVVDL